MTCALRHQPLTPILAAFTLAGAVASATACAKLPKSVRSTAASPLAAADRAELWIDPGQIAGRDLFHGPGEAVLMPGPGTRFNFVSRKAGGFSPGWDLRDEGGMEWSAKAGPEAQSEVVASRLLWAVGYHQPPTYYVTDWTLHGSNDRPQPSRFRPKLPSMRRIGEWSWHKNPFVGTAELNGLLVLMRIVNNWDLLERNNALYEVDGPGGAVRRYVAQDLGASFGKTQVMPSSGTRNDPDDFERQPFIKGVDMENGHVRFDDLGRWHRELFANIPPSHTRWICERLALLTDDQWNDAFRAGGYDERTAQRYIARIKSKIRDGLALPASP